MSDEPWTPKPMPPLGQMPEWRKQEICAAEWQVVCDGGMCVDGCGHVYPIRPVGSPPAACERCRAVPGPSAVTTYLTGSTLKELL